MKKQVKICLMTCLLAVALSLSACVNDRPEQSEAPQNGPPPESVLTPDAAEELFEDTAGMDLGFSKGDLDPDYDGESATVIALSDSGSTVKGEGALADGANVSITAAGTYILSGSVSDACITVETLNTEKVRLVLDGVSVTNKKGPAVYVKEADKVFLILAEGSENLLSDGESYEAAEGDTGLDGAVFSRADLTVNGSGALTVNGRYKHGMVSKDDLVITGGDIKVTASSVALAGKDCVKIGGGRITLNAGSDGIRSDNSEDENRGFVYISGGVLDITAENDGVQAETLIKIENGEVKLLTGGGNTSGPQHSEGMGGGMFPSWGFGGVTDTDSTESFKGLKAGLDILISGGSFDIDSADDAVHSNGSINISGGEISIRSGDDGIHADTALVISDGVINITKSYEGLESTDIAIFGGNISIVASDDGLNAAGGNDGSAMGRPGAGHFGGTTGSITVSGGQTVVDASGDGIDSNGTITVTGGTTFVNGPTNNGNGAFDYDSAAYVSGGTLVALGASGMAQGFSSAENQGAIFCNFSTQSGGALFEVCDEDGNVLISFTPSKSYQCAVITSPDIQKGSTYVVKSGGNVIATVEMTSELYGNAGGMGGMGGMGGGRPGGGGPGGGPGGGGFRP